MTRTPPAAPKSGRWAALAQRPGETTPAIAPEPRSALLRRPGAPWRSRAPRRARDYPFCDTANCPWWRGYCTRDPACND